MRRNRHFNIGLVLARADGQPSDLDRDLEVDRSGRLRRLEALTDDFLDEAQNMSWPRGAEGSWIYFPLADDIVICQWNPGEKGLWALGYKEAMLKVVRIIRKDSLPGFLSGAGSTGENE